MSGEEIRRRLQVFMEENYFGIPGKYIIAGLIVIFLLGAIYAITGGPGTGTIKLSVVSHGKQLEGANIQVISNGKVIKELTAGTGTVQLDVPLKEITIKATREGCKTVERTITPSPGMLLTLNMDCNLPSVLGAECISFAKNIDSVKIYVNGKPARNCKVAVFKPDGEVVDLGWEVRAGYKVLMSYDSKNCPTKDYTVKIDCSKVSTTLPMYSFLSDAKTYGKVSLAANKEEVPQEKIAEKVYDITVGVKDDKGNELSGITVKAVNSEGYPISLDYSNVITSASTDFNGVAKLVLPSGQTFYLKAVDPAENHPASKIYGPFVATQPLTESITMKSGFDSKIIVKDNETGEPILWASILAYTGTKLSQPGATDENGEAVLNLNKGEYTIVVSKLGYLPAKFTLVGGQDKTVMLQKLNDRNSAKVTLKIVNAHGYDDPIEDVTVYIRDLEGHSVTSGTSDSQGNIELGRLPAGTYVAYAPANDNKLENDVTQTFTVMPGKPTTVKISVIPPQVKLTIYTLVKGYPTPGVHVQVYNIKYNPIYPTLIGEADSETPGRASFTLDKGSEIYIKASFTDPNGNVFGPIVSQRINVDSDKEVKIDLSETTLTQEIRLSYTNITVNNTTYYVANSGEDGYITLPVSLPYYDPQKKEPFDSVDVEVFTGEIGALNSLEDTPIVIKDINALDYLRGNQDVYALKVFKSTAVLWTGPEELVADTDLHTAKYVDIRILNYTHDMIYTIKIPIRTRVLSNNTITHIYYRTVWRKGSAVYTSSPEGKWQNVTVNITGINSAKWVSSNNNQFYAYQAWLSADKDGKIKVKKISDGSDFYLQINLIARKDLPTWTFAWEIRPDLNIQPEEYSGYINRVNGNKVIIYPTSLSEDSITGENVSAEDEIHLAIKFHVDVGVPKDIIAQTLEGEFDIMGDRAHPLEFQITPTPEWEQTNIPNIMYQENIESYFAESGEWVTQSNKFISTYSYNLNEPRAFTIVYVFKNTGSEDKSLVIHVKDDGAFQNKPKALFCPIEVVNNGEPSIVSSISQPTTMCSNPIATVNKTFLVSAGGNVTVIIKGVGTPDLAYNSSTLYVYLGLKGENEVKLWKSYPHGMLDFVYLVSDAESGNKPTLDTVTLKVKVLKIWYENGQWNNETVLPAYVEVNGRVGNVQLSGSGLGGIVTYASAKPTKKYFIADVAGKLRPGNLLLYSTSEEYGKLVGVYHIGGLEFDPSGTDAISWNLTKAYNENQELTQTILITNLENEPVVINFTWYPNKPSAYGVGYSFSTFEPSGKEIGNSLTIPARGEMKITVYTQGVESCVNHLYYFDISGETEDGAPAGSNYYTFNFTCGGGNQQNIPSSKIIVIRDSTKLSDISTTSCGMEDKIAKVCDADQFVTFLVKAAENLKPGEKPSYIVNLGYESLDVNSMSAIAASLGYGNINIVKSGNETPSKDIIMPSNIGTIKCGQYKISMELTPQGDAKITQIQKAQDAPWCNPQSSRFAIGILNPDLKSRIKGIGVNLQGDEIKEFVNATLRAMQTMNLKLGDLYGYAGDDASTIANTLKQGGGATLISYTETNQKPDSIRCNQLGEGFEYCYSVETEPNVKLLIYLVYPSSSNPTSKQDKAKLEEYRIKMAKELLSEWFSKGTTPQQELRINIESQTILNQPSRYTLAISTTKQLDLGSSYAKIGGESFSFMREYIPFQHLYDYLYFAKGEMYISSNTTYTIHACDLSGNCKDVSGCINITSGNNQDTTPPTVTVISPTKLTSIGRSYWFKVRSSEPLSEKKSYVQFGLGPQNILTESGNNIYSFGPMSINSNITYLIHACDLAGNCRDVSGWINITSGNGPTPSECDQVSVDFTSSVISCGSSSCYVKLTSNSQPEKCFNSYAWFMLSGGTTPTPPSPPIPPVYTQGASVTSTILNFLPYLVSPVYTQGASVTYISNKHLNLPSISPTNIPINPPKPPSPVKWKLIGIGRSIVATVEKKSTGKASIKLSATLKEGETKTKIKIITLSQTSTCDGTVCGDNCCKLGTVCCEGECKPAGQGICCGNAWHWNTEKGKCCAGTWVAGAECCNSRDCNSGELCVNNKCLEEESGCTSSSDCHCSTSEIPVCIYGECTCIHNPNPPSPPNPPNINPV